MPLRDLCLDSNNVDEESQKIGRHAQVLQHKEKGKNGHLRYRRVFDFRGFCRIREDGRNKKSMSGFCDNHNIVNWEYILLGMIEAKDSKVCKITIADGSSSFHGDIQALLRRLDRHDLIQLYSLVQERFKYHPLEGYDLC
ncbi:hypothetical protein Tco_1389223 [Tanacetum coccineum]